MDTYTTNDESLEDLLNKIVKGTLQLPEFQRGWIWDDQNIRDLLVSIGSSFPIGAIMLLENGGDTEFFSRPVEGTFLKGEQPEPELLILDGQQRLTTLTQTLKSDHPVSTTNEKDEPIKRYYYIDINKALSGSNLEDAIVGVNSNRQKIVGRNVVLDLSTIEKECQTFHFPCNQIFCSNKWEKKLSDFDEKKRLLFIDFRVEFLQKFERYRIPSITLKKENKIDAVCTVFEKVNTNGVPLSVFELVTARFAAKGHNLRADWEEVGKQNVLCIEEKLKEKPILKDIRPTDFLQAITLLSTWKNAGTVSAKRKSILSLSLEDYKFWSPRVLEGFLLTAKFLKKQCIFSVNDLPYQPQIVSLSSILTLLAEKDRWRNPKIEKKLSQLYWCGVLGELYSGPIETRMANDLEDFIYWIDGEKENELPRTIQNATFHQDRLQRLKNRRSAAFKGLNAIILQENARDFFWNDSIEKLISDNESVDIHHIFPKKWCKNLELDINEYDSIINKTPISTRANRIIGGDSPAKYLSRLEKEGKIKNEVMDDILETHKIDPNTMRNDNFRSFFDNRKENLLFLIEKYMGKKINRELIQG